MIFTKSEQSLITGCRLNDASANNVVGRPVQDMK
jgi:hypothetical protein